jgi:hypothetical protein
MNRSQQIKFQVARFLGKDYQVGASKINLLELYESYLDFIRDNASGYQMSITDFSKEIKEVYPNTVIGDDKSVSGIEKRTVRERPAVVVDKLGNAITLQVSRLNHYSNSSFTAAEVAREGGLDEDEVSNWLQNSPRYYYNRHTNKFIRGSD